MGIVVKLSGSEARTFFNLIRQLRQEQEAEILERVKQNRESKRES